MKHARLEQIPPQFPYLEHLQAIDSSLVTITKSLSNKSGGTFCEWLKWICKPFEINGQKDF